MSDVIVNGYTVHNLAEYLWNCDFSLGRILLYISLLCFLWRIWRRHRDFHHRNRDWVTHAFAVFGRWKNV